MPAGACCVHAKYPREPGIGSGPRFGVNSTHQYLPGLDSMRLHTQIVRALCASVAVVLLCASTAWADAPPKAPKPGSGPRALVVYHGPTEPPVYIDNGAIGDSVGDVRIFHFTGTTDDGSPVVMDWIMTTTGVNTTDEGGESRVTLGVFSFTGADVDQLMLEGVGLYPGVDDTFTPNSVLVRPIIGGSGRFKGASGEVVSTHLEDGSWTHEFRLDNHRHSRKVH